MYVRDAKKREEVWLLEQIESMGLDDTAFRSRDYVIATDEESGSNAGFGRIRIHKGETEVCELTSIGVLEEWRGQGVGAHVVERLIEYAGDEGFDRVYSLTGEAGYLLQFGFRRIDEDELPEVLRDRLEVKREDTEPEALPVVLEVEDFSMPDRFRDAFKRAEQRERESTDQSERPEDFGIDPDTATYKYSTGR